MRNAGAEASTLAAGRFVAFFNELRGAFVERDDLLQQVALALLSRQHVLMTGPPGTAKSQLAHAVLGRIVSEETGQPSLFSRQFTESTVQTNLVGPIDFKTLMETGRTEHFTDEGILGAVHAFLDEVFDGRDMLLRSTLNVLQERELKEGTRTKAGRIECAIMTTNRYLAEILDNERLVAFVDRIAFLSFVPKGFATPDALESVLLAQVAGRRPPELTARLTIQDLDLLQTAVDGVYIDDAICTSLAALIRGFEAELATARRANPAFVPSRYLSTRTVVRMGGLLRAICYCDRLFNDPERPLEVLPRDLAHLRLAMTLCGPDAAQAGRLMETETDPRERRQLAIVRTERELFERCLAALSSAPGAAGAVTVPHGAERAKAIDAALLKDSVGASLREHSVVKLLGLSRALAVAASSGQRGADEARLALAGVLDELVRRALRSGLAATAAGDPEPAALAASLSALARDLEGVGRAHARTARWLRARALEVVERGIQINAVRIGEVLSTLVMASGDLASLGATVDAILGRAEQLGRLREGLRHAGVDERDAHAANGAWTTAAERLAADLSPVVGAGLQLVAQAARVSGSGAPEGEKAVHTLQWELTGLEPLLAFARTCGDRLDALGAKGAAFFAQVATPLVAVVAREAFERAGTGSRAAVSTHIERQVVALEGAGVLHALEPGDVIAWAAAALAAAREPAPAVDDSYGPEGFRGLRGRETRGTLAELIVDLYLRLAAGDGEELRDPSLLGKHISRIVETIPAETRQALARRDMEQLGTEIAYLERWWAEVSAAAPKNPAAALGAIVRSRYFQLTHDEGVLTRLELEARLVAMVFGEVGVEALLERAKTLERTSSGVTRDLMAWRAGRTAGGETTGSPPKPS